MLFFCLFVCLFALISEKKSRTVWIIKLISHSNLYKLVFHIISFTFPIFCLFAWWCLTLLSTTGTCEQDTASPLFTPYPPPFLICFFFSFPFPWLSLQLIALYVLFVVCIYYQFDKQRDFLRNTSKRKLNPMSIYFVCTTQSGAYYLSRLFKSLHLWMIYDLNRTTSSFAESKVCIFLSFID